MKKISLTQGMFAIVDDEDYDHINSFRWFAHKERHGIYYAYRNASIKNSYTRMHRMILRARSNFEIDHINGNGLDNRRCNIRLCSHAENLRNQTRIHGKSKYKGVWWDKNNNKWSCGLTFNYKQIWIGRFISEIEAAKAYDNKAKELFGDFAYLNFPASKYNYY